MAKTGSTGRMGGSSNVGIVDEARVAPEKAAFKKRGSDEKAAAEPRKARSTKSDNAIMPTDEPNPIKAKLNREMRMEVERRRKLAATKDDDEGDIDDEFETDDEEVDEVDAEDEGDDEADEEDEEAEARHSKTIDEFMGVVRRGQPNQQQNQQPPQNQQKPEREKLKLDIDDFTDDDEEGKKTRKLPAALRKMQDHYEKVIDQHEKAFERLETGMKRLAGWVSGAVERSDRADFDDHVQSKAEYATVFGKGDTRSLPEKSIARKARKELWDHYDNLDLAKLAAMGVKEDAALDNLTLMVFNKHLRAAKKEAAASKNRVEKPERKPVKARVNKPGSTNGGPETRKQSMNSRMRSLVNDVADWSGKPPR